MSSSVALPHLLVAYADQFTRLQGSTMGRDKVAKVLQYGAKIASHLVQKRQQQHHHPLTTAAPLPSPPTGTSTALPLSGALRRISAFEGGVGTGRKVMRFFRFLPGYVAMLQYILKVLRSAFRAAAAAGRGSRRGGGDGETKMMQAGDGGGGDRSSGGGRQAGESREERLVRLLRLPSWLEELLTVLNKFLLGHYFLLDTLGWSAKLGLLADQDDDVGAGKSGGRSLLQRYMPRNSQAAQYGKKSAQCWFLGVMCALLLDANALTRGTVQEAALLKRLHTAVASVHLQNSEESTQHATGASDDLHSVEEIERALAQVQDARRARLLGTVANLCDFFVALAITNTINLSKGAVGALGTLNGLIGVYKLWPAA